MRKSRRNHAAGFKAKVALASMKFSATNRGQCMNQRTRRMATLSSNPASPGTPGTQRTRRYQLALLA